MATSTITGTINGVNNAALANKWITFRLVQLGTDSGATATVAQSVDSVQTDANGDFSIDIWTNGDSGKTSVLEITIDGSKAENVIIPTGTASIELWDLIENYQADGSTSEQVPFVSDLFVRKASNLSDLGSASTSRANLGVAIGTDVQAHSAVLDATTASFTIADESKLDGVEALADVTDATNIAASGGYVAGGTDVALTDGGTGASDAPTARTNLDIPSNAEAVLVANNLSELTLTSSTARTNLGVAIGSNVQAHSAILDATDASFTVAKDAAISTNTTDTATNTSAIALNSAKVTNATHTGDVTGDTVLTIAADAVDIAKLSATGTADATTFLRGDNTWATPAAGGGGDMLASVYDPTAIEADAFARSNHNGTQLASTISDFDSTVSSNAKLEGYSPIAIITESTTARSLSLTDISAYIRLTNASPCTITIPANATVDWAGETEPPTIYVRVAATGIPTLSNAGVTINDTLGVIAALEVGSTFALQWVSSNVWDII